MLTTDDCFYIGYVKKAHGLDGEIEIVLDVDDPSKYKKKESVLLEIKGNLVPFFFTQLVIRRSSAFVRLKNIQTPAEVETVIGAQAWLPLGELPPLKGKKQFYYHEVTGYTVMDEHKGNIGILLSVMDNMHQPVLQIMQGEKEILIPLVDNFLKEVNKTEKIIYLATPEGLIDLYLE